jgi:hypothetical protein
MSAMSVGRFLLLDAAGAMLFNAIFLAAGFAAGPQLVSAVQTAMRFGGFLALGVGIALGVWLSWKVAQRSRVLRTLRVTRIEPSDLLARLASANPPLVVDLRSELIAGGETIRGAHRVLREDLPRWAEEVPRDRDIILTCD